jgi:Flp pilus assembly protein TadB
MGPREKLKSEWLEGLVATLCLVVVLTIAGMPLWITVPLALFVFGPWIVIWVSDFFYYRKQR